MYEVEFLFDNQLISQLENIIKEANRQLLLISPFIDLDSRIKDALSEKKNDKDFKLRVLFGKNENNIYKSVKKDSMDFLKDFPDVDIRYESRLHAKFYMNEHTYLMTSLNLYDYSLANNIEVGITNQYASKGVIMKVLDHLVLMVANGLDKIKKKVFGSKKEVDPIEKFEMIFEAAEKMYKTEPDIVKKSGVAGLVGGKMLSDKRYNIIYDNFSNVNSAKKVKEKKPEIIKENRKTLSTSQLAKKYKVQPTVITELMHSSGYIDGDVITPTGKQAGLEMKKYMGNNYIAYPENLEVFNTLKN